MGFISTHAVRFDFYRIVQLPDEVAIPLSSAMGQTMPSNHMPVLHYDKYVRLEEFTRNGPVCTGVLSLITMNNLPNRASIDRPGIEPLGASMAESEGIAGLTSFLYSEPYDLVVLQRNFQGVREGGFVRLLNALTNAGPFRLLPIFEKDLLTKLRRMQIIRDFRVKIANPTDPGTFATQTRRASSQLAQAFEARQVAIQVNIGNAKGNLLADAVYSEAQGLLAVDAMADGATVSTLKVKGKDFDDDGLKWLDLLRERFTAEVDVPLRARGLPSDDLQRAVRQAYEQKLGDLEHYRAV